MLHQSHAATTSSLKTAKGLFFFHPQETLSSHLHQQHKEHHGGGIRWGAGVGELLFWGNLGTQTAFNHSEQHGKTAHMPCRPGSRQALNRRLAPQGQWGIKQDSEEGGLREAGEASARQDGRHLLHHVLGSHGDKTEPPHLHPNPYSSRTSSTHSPRAHSMVADRRGWWGRGLAALLRLPAPAFRLSALHICRTKAMFVTSVDSDKNIFIYFMPAYTAD